MATPVVRNMGPEPYIVRGLAVLRSFCGEQDFDNIVALSPELASPREPQGVDREAEGVSKPSLVVDLDARA